MKKLVLYASMALMAAGAFAFDSDPLDLQGNVESYTKTEYSVASKFGDYFRTVSAKYVHTYEDGLRKEIASYTSKDELVDKTAFTYNPDRTLATMTCIDSEGKITKKISYEYLEDGSLKSESEFNSENTLTAKIIYKYESGKTIESYYNSDGKLVTRTISTVAADGKIIEASFYFGDGSLDHSEKYTYTENGSISVVENMDSDGKKAGKTVYRYDGDEMLTEIQIYATDTDIIERDIFKNDAAGNPVRVSVYSIAEKFGTTANELVSITDYSYKY